MASQAHPLPPHRDRRARSATPSRSEEHHLSDATTVASAVVAPVATNNSFARNPGEAIPFGPKSSTLMVAVPSALMDSEETCAP